MVHHDHDLADMVVEDAAGHTATVHTTIDHPVWDQSKRAFVEVGRLGRGERLQNLGRRVRVLAVVPLIGANDMYDLTVSTKHTFFVMAGAAPVLVHNENGAEGCRVWSGGEQPLEDDVATAIEKAYPGRVGGQGRKIPREDGSTRRT